MKNISKEDYIRAIHLVQEQKEEVRSVDIVEKLGVSKPSVSSMIKKLASEGLVKMKPYSSIFLTEKGRRIASKLTAKHRVVEVFLKEALDYKKDVHGEAHQLEHAFSDESIRRLRKFLKDPKHCPHGKKIP